MDPTINNPHDKFAKEMLSQKSFAIIFLTEYLPSEVKDCLDMETLTYSPNSFINESLEERFSDIVFKVQMKEQHGDCFVSILIENKANPSKYVSIQVLEYLSSAYAAQVKAKEQIYPVIPILYYQGKEKWKVESMADLLKTYPKALMEYVPNYKSVFVGLFGLTDESLNQLEDNALRTYLSLQRYRYDPNALVKQMQQIINSIDPYYSKNYLRKFFVYILEAVELTEDHILEIFEPINPKIKSEFMSTYDLLIAKGEAKGIEKGKAEGKAEGMAEGSVKAKHEMIQAAFQNNIPVETIAKMAKLTVEEIQDILNIKKN